MNIRSLIFVALAATVLPVAAAGQMQPPQPMTTAQFESTPSGAPVQIVVRVRSLQRENLQADLLAQVDASHYKTTGTQLDLYFSADTPVVMGSAADVKDGAVLYIYAVATTRNRADVKKAVVVTPFVKVL
jgi:hypothetical protein